MTLPTNTVSRVPEATQTIVRPSRLVVPFPLPARGSRLNKPVLIYPELIGELGIEEMATYLRIALWYQNGEESTVQRLADELWQGSAWRAEMWIHELARRGLVCDQGDWRRQAAELVERENEAKVARTSADNLRRKNATYLDGRWSGDWPVTRRCSLPARGVPVVYFQYDSAGQIAYIGSTKDFAKRMANHADHPRSAVWARWEARECAARDEAYAIESREIEGQKPYQNKPTRAVPQFPGGRLVGGAGR